MTGGWPCARPACDPGMPSVSAVVGSAGPTDAATGGVRVARPHASVIANQAGTVACPVAAGMAGIVTWAPWMRRAGSDPMRTRARPGRRWSRSAASGRPMMSTESARPSDPERDAQVGVGADVVADRRRAVAGWPAPGARRGCDRAGRRPTSAWRKPGARPRARRTRRSPPPAAAAAHAAVAWRAGSAARSAAPWSRSTRLAAAELGVQAAQRPVGQLVVEVGDHADDVRQRAAASNVAPPL